jgi:hypothetical protein
VLVFLGGVAKIYPNLSDDAKKYQLAFLVPLLGMDSISKPGSDAKKHQQHAAILIANVGKTSLQIIWKFKK